MIKRPINLINYTRAKERGAITALVLIFGAIFLTLLAGLSGFLLMQHRSSLERAAFANSLHIAEAGLNYYRWHLEHDPEDLTDGTGGPGPYLHAYNDPEGGTLGNFSLEINADTICAKTSGITISSTGWTADFPNVKRTVRARYVKPTVADFSFLLNSDVWVGADHEIKGPYHSNGGIRMDGENNSLVTSAKETWLCTASFGCSPAQEKPGIFGSGENSDLWRFPVPPFDFAGITVDLAGMKSIAQGGNGLYFGPSQAKGYRAVFNDNRTVDVWKVNTTSWVWAYSLEKGWHQEYSTISSETFLGNFALPSDCGLVFFEDNLWVGSLTAESKIKGKVTVAAADLVNPNKEVDIWIQGNIEYTARDGRDGFLLLAERDNLIALFTPDILLLDGIYLAQTGKFGRNHYPSTYSPYHKRQKLELFGSIVSNGRVGTKWTCGGIYCSGYEKRETTYDPKMSFSPPPFLPATSAEFQFKEWEEIR